MTRPTRQQRTAISRVDFYPDDWLAGTLELSPDQRGVYITLCALYFSRQGRLQDNERWIAGMCNLSLRMYRKIKNELLDLGKIEIIDGFIYQERAEIELENAMKAKSAAQENGSKGGLKSAEIRANALKRNKTTSSEASSEDEPEVKATPEPPPPPPIPFKEEGGKDINKPSAGAREEDSPPLSLLKMIKYLKHADAPELYRVWCEQYDPGRVDETISQAVADNCDIDVLRERISLLNLPKRDPDQLLADRMKNNTGFANTGKSQRDAARLLRLGLIDAATAKRHGFVAEATL